MFPSSPASSSFGGTSSGNGEGGTAGDGNCFAPVDMYIMFDKSGSMGEPTGNGAPGDCNVGETKNSKWCRAINALAGYLKSPQAKDQAAALQFFSSVDNPSCQQGSPYDKPATPAADFTTLPSQNFETVLNAYYPTTTDVRLTPIRRRMLRALSAWRYKMRIEAWPLELNALQRVFHYQRPETTGF